MKIVNISLRKEPWRHKWATVAEMGTEVTEGVAISLIHSLLHLILCLVKKPYLTSTCCRTSGEPDRMVEQKQFLADSRDPPLSDEH